MKKRRALFLLLLILLLILLPSAEGHAQTRKIYVGDLIRLNISSSGISEAELRESFKDFELVELNKEKSGYKITLRSFDTGEKLIKIGGQELKITVYSTLKDFDRSDIYEGDLSPVKAGFSLKWQYVFYASALIFTASSGVILYRRIKSGKRKALNPYQRFLSQMDGITYSEEDCFVKQTRCLKNYLETSFPCSLTGKTTSELVEELIKVPELQTELEALHSWLLESDIYKYTKASATLEQKQRASMELKELVKNINERKGAEA